MEDTRVSQDAHQFWIGLFLGGLVGGLMVVLLGTEKGRKLAQNLADEGLDLWEDTKDRVGEKLDVVQTKVAEEVEDMELKGQDLMRKGRMLLEQSKKVQGELTERVQELKTDVTQQAVASADEALAHIEQLQERGRQTTADLRKRLFKNIPKK